MTLRLLWGSPLPPTRTGVADYAMELLPELARRATVRLLMPPGGDARAAASRLGLEVVPADAPLLPGELQLISLGNNPHHEWLLPRLARFGLEGRFERVCVSDAIGFVKPEPGAFEFVRDVAAGRTVRYVDDNPVNVAAAGAIFDEALGLDQVDRLRRAPVG